MKINRLKMLSLLVLFLSILPGGVLTPAQTVDPADSLDLHIEGALHTVPTLREGAEEYVPLEALAQIFGASLLYDNARVNVVLEYRGRKALLSVKESVVTIGDRIHMLTPPPRQLDNRLVVPLEFITKVFGALYPDGAIQLEGGRTWYFGKGGPVHLAIQIESEETLSRVRILYRGHPRYQVTADPEGIWVLFGGDGEISTSFDEKEVGDGVIRSVRFGRADDGRSGVRVTVGDDFHLHRVGDLTERGEIRIDLFRRIGTKVPGHSGRTSEEESGAANGDPSRAGTGHDRRKDQLDAGPRQLRSIVIDPGHGGSETGAVGRNGLLEKDVALDIARRLSRLLQERAGLEVYLTRERDETLPLESRTAMANHHHADLFISLHANASSNPRARGSETFFLSDTATDDEARNLAALENVEFGEVPRTSEMENDDLRMILWDMAQTEYLLESSRFAERIQEELNRLLDTPNRGIKQAPFRVLMGATMPAVLVEVAFISNPGEERLLLTDSFREKVATALYRSILDFQKQYEKMGR